MKRKPKPTKVKIYPLKLDDIHFPAINFQEEYTQEELNNIINSIQKGETTNCIYVKFSTNGYEFVKGWLVLNAYLKLERKIIPSIIIR